MHLDERVGLDELDMHILAYLQRDGRTPYTTMGRALGVSEGTVRKRVKRLEEEGYVQIVGVTDPFRTGLDTVVFIWFKVDRDRLSSVMEELCRLKETRYVAVATGAFDLVAIVILRSRQELLRFLTDKLGEIPGIRETDTSVLLEICKQRYDWTPWSESEMELQEFEDEDRDPVSEPLTYDSLDDTDKQVISYLQKDGRYRFADMAGDLGVTERTIRRRVSALIDSGLLRIVGVINPFKVSMNTVAVVGVKVQRHHIDRVVEELVHSPEVRYVAISTGSYDLIIEVVLQNNQELYDFLIDKLTQMDGVSHTDTSMVLKISKQQYSWGTG